MRSLFVKGGKFSWGRAILTLLGIAVIGWLLFLAVSILVNNRIAKVSADGNVRRELGEVKEKIEGLTKRVEAKLDELSRPSVAPPAAPVTAAKPPAKPKPKPPVPQVQAQAGPPKLFATKEACREARTTGNFTYYEPKFFSRRGENPVDGVSRVRAVLESDACVRMLTVSGMQWVVQKEGTAFRFHAANGVISSPVPYARDDCGNPVDDIDPKGSMKPASTALPQVAVTLTANPTKVPHGGSTVLTWRPQNAAACVASGDWSGTKHPLGGIEELKNLVSTNKVFAITCTGQGGSANAIANVEVEFKVSEAKPAGPLVIVAPSQREIVVIVPQPQPQVVYAAPQPQVMYAAPQMQYAPPMYAAPAYGYGGGGFNLNLAYSRSVVNGGTVTPFVTPPVITGGPPIVGPPVPRVTGGPPIIGGGGGMLPGAGVPRPR